MEGVRDFLESSTIHGLNYISTTEKYSRFFWVIIVASGFTVAGLLINESFQSWSQSPVKTTIETLPISDITFPKVTVCPPKNTFTNLNHELVLADNRTWTDEMMYDWNDTAVKLIDEHVFMDVWNAIQEDNRYFNWYHGYTKISPPTITEDTFKCKNCLKMNIDTFATAGVIQTQYYGEPFQSHLVDTKLYFNINICPPKSAYNKSDVTLNFKVEKRSIMGLSSGWDQVTIVDTELDNEDQIEDYFSFTPPGDIYSYLYLDTYTCRNLRFWREVSQDDVEDQDMDLMPGFKLSWWYTGLESGPESNYHEEENPLSKQFIRYNFHNYGGSDNMYTIFLLFSNLNLPLANFYKLTGMSPTTTIPLLTKLPICNLFLAFLCNQ